MLLLFFAISYLILYVIYAEINSIILNSKTFNDFIELPALFTRICFYKIASNFITKSIFTLIYILRFNHMAQFMPKL